MSSQNNPYLTKDRLEMFSDGVFAIVITLLVLEIKVPKHEDLHAAGGLYNYLIKLWPSYVAYIIGFITTGIYWSNHHWLFSFITKTNHTFNLINVLSLMTIALMPFTAAILGEYYMELEYRNAAVTTFCIGYLLPIPFITIVVFYAVHKRRLVDIRLSQKFINNLLMKLSIGMVIAIVALILSFNYPLISISILILVLLTYLFPPETPVYIGENGEEIPVKDLIVE